MVEVVGFVPPDLWAAVEVEPDEQRLDLEEVELGLRALWEAVATDLVEDNRVQTPCASSARTVRRADSQRGNTSCSGKRHRHCH